MASSIYSLDQMLSEDWTKPNGTQWAASVLDEFVFRDLSEDVQMAVVRLMRGRVEEGRKIGLEIGYDEGYDAGYDAACDDLQRVREEEDREAHN